MFLPARIVPFYQIFGHLLDAHAIRRQQHNEVVQHVRTLLDEALVGSVDGFDDGLQRFFSYLLRHAVQSVPEKAGRV